MPRKLMIRLEMRRQLAIRMLRRQKELSKRMLSRMLLRKMSRRLMILTDKSRQVVTRLIRLAGMSWKILSLTLESETEFSTSR
jgi:hypothetical protein